MQYGDPDKGNSYWEMCQGSSSANKYILQFKGEASQTNVGDQTLVEYLKAWLNPMLLKSIYQLPVIPETLKEWYEQAWELDGQYRQEQVAPNY